MSFSVKQLNHEPVVWITLDDAVDKNDVIQAYLQSIDLAMTIPGLVYRIVDLRHAPYCYHNIIAAIQEIVTGLTGAAVHPQLAIAFLGTREMVLRDHIPDIAIFSKRDAALASFAYLRRAVG